MSATAEPFVCLYFGWPDECQNCGGSATLGGTQDAFKNEHGSPFCSLECLDEADEFAARDKERCASDWCPVCGYDNHEHADDCAAPSPSPEGTPEGGKE